MLIRIQKTLLWVITAKCYWFVILNKYSVTDRLRKKKEDEEREKEKTEERERRELGKQLQQFKQAQQEREQRELAESRQKQKREEKEALEKIRQQIAQDKSVTHQQPLVVKKTFSMIQ